LIPGSRASYCILWGMGKCLKIHVARLASPGSSIGRLLPEQDEPQLRSSSSSACRCASPSRHRRTRLAVLTAEWINRLNDQILNIDIDVNMWDIVRNIM
jgi:hypothetical protein